MRVQFLLLFCLFVTATAGNGSKVIVLSVGALGRDTVNTDLPKMDKIRETMKKLAYAEYLMPVMPTKGLVNHMSIGTGLFAEDHGVFDDCKYDEPDNKCVYGMPDVSKKPVWIENEKQGGISGAMNWPGAEWQYQDTQIHYYNNDEYHQIGGRKGQIDGRISTIISWLQHDTYPANLVMVYYGELDEVLHEHGISSDEAKYEVENAAYFIQELIQKVDKISDVSLIVLGSHGGQTVHAKNGIDLNTILKGKYACHVDAMGGNALVTPKDEGQLVNVYKILEENVKTNKKYSVYYQKDIPEDWQLKKMPLIQNKIFLVANIGYFFWNEYLRRIEEKQQPYGFEVTVDGYWKYTENDPTYIYPTFTHTFFMAKGSKFVSQTQVPPFNTTDVYPLIRKLLELPENENEKLSDSVKALFKPGLLKKLKSTLSCIPKV